MRTLTEMRYVHVHWGIPFSCKHLDKVYYFKDEGSMKTWVEKWNPKEPEFQYVVKTGKCWFDEKGLLCPHSLTSK